MEQDPKREDDVAKRDLWEQQAKEDAKRQVRRINAELWKQGRTCFFKWDPLGVMWYNGIDDKGRYIN